MFYAAAPFLLLFAFLFTRIGFTVEAPKPCADYMRRLDAATLSDGIRNSLAAAGWLGEGAGVIALKVEPGRAGPFVFLGDVKRWSVGRTRGSFVERKSSTASKIAFLRSLNSDPALVDRIERETGKSSGGGNLIYTYSILLDGLWEPVLEGSFARVGKDDRAMDADFPRDFVAETVRSVVEHNAEVNLRGRDHSSTEACFLRNASEHMVSFRVRKNWFGRARGETIVFCPTVVGGDTKLSALERNPEFVSAIALLEPAGKWVGWNIRWQNDHFEISPMRFDDDRRDWSRPDL